MTELIAAIWSEVLDIAPPDITADFFDLGGHSLAAVKILSRLEAQYDLELPVVLLFEYPVFGEFVQAVGEAIASFEEESV
ncbi:MULTISPECIES: phosphopantetheine-binding protein [unclassified Streptomyces]|uniref:phosphopantetheine-binding protein n=1 Tax=unclassified Streptomyces TaxID=2593676 RepID=UPI0037FE7A6E